MHQDDSLNSIKVLKQCYQCNKELNPYNNIYRAYDTSLCSKECLKLRCKYIDNIDPRSIHPELWNNNLITTTIPVYNNSIYLSDEISEPIINNSKINNSKINNSKNIVRPQMLSCKISYSSLNHNNSFIIDNNYYPEPPYIKYVIYLVTTTLTFTGLFRAGTNMLFSIL